METRDALPLLSNLKVKLLEESERKIQVGNFSVDVVGEAQAYAVWGKNSEKGEKCKNKNSFNKNKQNFKCFKCGRRGHYAANCYSNLNPKEEKVTKRSEHSYTVLAAADKQVFDNSMWLLDSGATAHMCSDRSMFTVFKEYKEKIILAGNNFLTAEGIGEVRIKSEQSDITLREVLYVPNMCGNFMSVARAVENGIKVNFDENCAKIEKENELILTATKVNKLFVFRNFVNNCFHASDEKMVTWHERYGHLNYGSMKNLIDKNMVRGIDRVTFSKNIKCEVCAKCKISVQPFPHCSENRSKDLLSLIHTDVCGPFRTQSLSGARYFLTFIDDKSRKIFVYFLKSKDEVFEKFLSFKNMVEKQTERKIKTIRSDNGREFANKQFDEFLNKNGIKRQLTVPYTPQQNGVAERANRTIVEMARSMLVGSGLGEFLWAEAVATAVFLRNRSPTKVLQNTTPYEVWTGRKPYVKFLRVFGSDVVALDKTVHSKFSPKGKKYSMVGYSLKSKAYRLYDAEQRMIVEKRDVIFFESVRNEEQEQIHVNEILSVNNSENTYDDSFKKKGGTEGEKGSEYAKEWMQAMESEYDALVRNNTWQLQDLPEGEKAIGSKWVFTLKRDKDGEIERFKARLVAKGCSQQFGVNYNETFSPVVRYATIRMVLAIAAELKMYTHQMDVCNAYLNSELADTVFMKQPEKFISKQYPERVLRLNKAIYGLKQSGREWNSKLDEVLKQIGFTSCPSERCLYKMIQKGNLCLIAVYVDDLIISCQSKNDLLRIKAKILESFDCVDKGPISYFLGMEITREGETGTITIAQTHYIKDLLKQHHMIECRPATTPLDAGFQIGCNSSRCVKIDAEKYQSSVGALMYLAISTRPDILHSISKLAQRNHDPHKEHESGIKHVMRYLAGTAERKLVYRAVGKPIEGYVDADWGSNNLDRKSYTGYTFFLGGSTISWESKRQSSVALSSTEAEYIALATAAKEAVYLKRLMNEIGINGYESSITLYGDNLSAQQLAKNPIYHARSKHIDIRYHFVREAVVNKEINLKYVCSNDMVADVLTKNVTKTKHEKFVKLLGFN